MRSREHSSATRSLTGTPAFGGMRRRHLAVRSIPVKAQQRMRPPGAFGQSPTSAGRSNRRFRLRTAPPFGRAIHGPGQRSVPSVGICVPSPMELRRHGSPGCCSASPAYSCSGSQTGSSCRSCSSSRRASRGSRPVAAGKLPSCSACGRRGPGPARSRSGNSSPSRWQHRRGTVRRVAGRAGGSGVTTTCT